MGTLNYNSLVLLVIFLIVSITPASAELISGSYGNGTNQSTVQHGVGTLTDNNNIVNSLENNIENSTNELEGQLHSLGANIDYIKKRSDNFSWKVWKWPGIIKEITNTMFKILDTTKKLQEPANNLKENTEKLKALQTSSSDENVVTDIDLTGDANQMARNLTKNLDTQVTQKKVLSNEIKEGDIVQYLSHEQYPRYLLVSNINLNNTLKQTKSNTNPPIPVLFLKGSGNMLTMAHMEDNYIKLEFSGIKPTTVLNEAMHIQKSNIEQIKARSNDLKAKGEEYKDLGKHVLYVALGFGGLAILILVLGTLAGLGPLAIIAAGIVGLIAVIVGIAGGILYELCEYYNSEADDLLKMYNYANNDLNQYTTDLNTTSMNITTYNGVPIVKHPPMTDWKDYEFLLITLPNHGTVLSGPGIQYLYGPNEGYTGNDQFTYQYSKGGKTLGIINVSIQINPIPALPVPLGGKN